MKKKRKSNLNLERSISNNKEKKVLKIRKVIRNMRKLKRKNNPIHKTNIKVTNLTAHKLPKAQVPLVLTIL